MVDGLYLSQNNGKIMNSIDYIWAYYSEAQSALKHELENNQLDFNASLEKGIAYWLLNKPELLKEYLSNVAKIEFMKKRDPNDVAIIYVLLGRITALAALYRLNKEQKRHDFLMRNFTIEKNKVAAMKNGFVLTSQHKYTIAIALFPKNSAVL